MKTAKQFFLFFLILGVFLSSCTTEEIYLPSSNDNEMLYSFADYATGCSLYTNISTTNASGICGSQRTAFSYYLNNTWNLACCTFGSKCSNESITNINNACVQFNSSRYTSTTLYSQGEWKSLCCNSNGASCYIDSNINIYDNATICNEEYTYDIVSITFNSNSSRWDNVCCTGGIE